MPQLSNSPRQHTVLRLEREKSFALGLFFVTADGGPVDLTGATVRFSMTKPQHLGGAVVLWEWFVNQPEDVGYTRVLLNALDLVMDVGEYDFAITHISPSGYTTVVVKGTVEIVANAEPQGYAELNSGYNPPTNLTVVLELSHIHVKLDNITPATLTIGTVTSVANDTPASAYFTGHYPNQQLNLELPVGETGPPPNITIGTVTSALPGEPPSATITGTSPNYTLNMVLPVPGVYQLVAIDLGNGTINVESPLLTDNGDGTVTLDLTNTETLLQCPPNLGSIGPGVFGVEIDATHNIIGFAEINLDTIDGGFA